MQPYFLGKPPARSEATIRPASLDDVVRMRILRLEALLDSPQAFGGDFEDNAARTLAWWGEKITLGAQDGSETMVVAKARGRLVGMSGMVRGRSRKARHIGMVYGVYVQPAWRSLGIGEALVSTCLEWGRENAVRVAQLGVAVGNTPAIRCYERLGFKVYGREQMAIHSNGCDIDEYLMDVIL